MIRPICLAIVAMACLTATAQAKVLQAEDVLAPGQSGYVSIPGVATGTGSEHLTDQVGLFGSFTYKSQMFDQPGTTESPRAGVSIVRDSYGVPAVTGASDYDAWWGVGYAVAQDRLFQLELFRRATSGRLAEILGSTYLDDDLIARRDYYTDAEVDSMVAAIPAKLHTRLEAYRDGINAWIEHVSSPGLPDMPGEFVALSDLPVEPWTLRDSARVGVYLARTVPSSDGRELANALDLDALGPKDFDTLLPVHSKHPRLTVPPEDGTFPSQPGRTRHDERVGFRRSQRFLAHAHLANATDTATQIPVQTKSAGAPGAGLTSILPHGGSFMWAIQDPERGRAYLFNGPQLGFSIPELFVEFELHSPAQPDLRGVSAAGVPLVGIGHNDHLAWGFTSGLSDEDDLFAEKLTGPESYRFHGKQRRMDCRDEVFDYNTPATNLPDLITDPGAPSGSVTQRICRTVHGPVQFTGDGVALARRYAVWGRELETIVGLSKLNDATDVGRADKAMRQVTWNENVIAADDHGEIGYWHPGLHPLRPLRWDERLPYPGDGRAEWRGLLPRGRTPHVIDPEQGWLTNWNNLPSAGWTNGDSEALERLAGPLHRVRILQSLVSKVAEHPSYRRSTRIAETSGTTAQQFPFVSRRKLRRAEAIAKGPGKAALGVLLAWDGDYATADAAGTVDPGVATWEEFKDRLEAILLAPMADPGAAADLAGNTGLSHQFDITNGESLALRTLGPRAYARAANATAAALTTEFGTPDASAWREPRRMYEVSAQGAGASPDLPFFDRGTWNQSVALGGR
ncbi:MAG: penicillin amidase [Solirubrobacterales bacterium]|nr:penicillin amidase [Solirubrobacterales bacterium]